MTKPFDPFNQCTEYAYQIQELLAANAALEAEVVRLREVIFDMAGEESGISWGKADKVLSTPFTPQALPELIEKVEKRTIERCAERASFFTPYVGNKIRALPTGQIKLECLL